jgi:ubiquitin thioesterase OTU1
MNTAPAIIVRRHVPNDHECLFTAVAYMCEGSRFNGAGQRLRKVCSDAILADPETFNEGILGKPTAEYAEWILNPYK